MSEVEIHHPQWGRTMQVPAEMYPGRLAAKGWQLVRDVPAAAEPSPEPEPPAGSFVAYQERAVDAKVRLRQILTERGVTGWDGRTGVKKLRQLVEESE